MIAAGKYEIEEIYLDNHLLGIVKPPNMPVQKDASGDLDVLTALKAYIGERFQKPGAVYLGLVHRLDRPVGGAMVLARTSKAAARLSAQFAGHDVQKDYLCVLQGAQEEKLELVDWLWKDERTGNVSVVPEGTPGAKRAQLVSEPLLVKDGRTLAKVRLLTGRAHQIRVQHMHAGFPIWGDNRYGGGLPGQQLALWAHSLRFEHPTLHEAVTLTSNPPQTGIWAAFKEAIP